jgi:hypothetical protein
MTTSQTASFSVVPTNVFGTTVDGTAEPYEPPGYHQLSTVWYQWTPAVAGNVRLRVAFTNDDYIQRLMVMTHFTGDTLSNLTQHSTTFFSGEFEINLPVTAGITNQFRFAPDQEVLFPRSDGPFSFTLEYNTPPPNDHFTNRIRLTNDVELIIYRNVVATTEPGETLNHAGGHSVWYEWTPTSPAITHLTHLPRSGSARGDSGVSVYLAWSNQVDQLFLLTNTCSGDLLFYATNGQKYFFQFDKCPVSSSPDFPPEPRWLLSHGFAARALNITYTPTEGASITYLRDHTRAYSISSSTNVTGPWTNHMILGEDIYGGLIYTFKHPQATNYPGCFYGIQPVIE